MSERSESNGSPPDSLERFEDLARRLLGAGGPAAGPRARGTWLVTNVRRFATRMLGKEKTEMDATQRDLRCSFCGKDKDHVQFLIAGPKVFICGGCVELCVDIINKSKASGTAPPPPATA
jgi:ClpX C4-type zinc finger